VASKGPPTNFMREGAGAGQLGSHQQVESVHSSSSRHHLLIRTFEGRAVTSQVRFWSRRERREERGEEERGLQCEYDQHGTM
jgi:hypothetical protein